MKFPIPVPVSAAEAGFIFKKKKIHILADINPGKLSELLSIQ